MSGYHLRLDQGRIYTFPDLCCWVCGGDVRIAEKINLWEGDVAPGTRLLFSGMGLCFTCGATTPYRRVRTGPLLRWGLGDENTDPWWAKMSYVEQRDRHLLGPPCVLVRPSHPPSPPVPLDPETQEAQRIAGAIAAYYDEQRRSLYN